MDFVAYYRVSTDKQGRSGLGLDAQKQAVRTYFNGGNWRLIAEYTENESGNKNAPFEINDLLCLWRVTALAYSKDFPLVDCDKTINDSPLRNDLAVFKKYFSLCHMLVPPEVSVPFFPASSLWTLDES